tara:strand:+ start:1646 stop:2572 length:927 start_codon:yes stop_codon:yes gene_type:complete
MIKILILGGSSYLGKNFINLYKNKLKLFYPTKKKLNLLNIESINKYFKKNSLKIDIILNFSVYQKTGEHLINEKKNIIIKNSILNSNILYLWNVYLKNSKMISMGASCAYSSKDNINSYFHGTLHNSVEHYAIQKRYFAKMCKNLNQKNNMKYLILVPGTLIGAGEQMDLSKKHFFNGALLRAAIYKNNKSKKYDLYGNRNITRELSDVSYVSKFIYKKLNFKKSKVINIMPDFRINLGQFYDYICKELQIKSTITNKRQKFKAAKEKMYKVSVKYDLTLNKIIDNKKFINLFNETYNYYDNKLKNYE